MPAILALCERRRPTVTFMVFRQHLSIANSSRHGATYINIGHWHNPITTLIGLRETGATPGHVVTTVGGEHELRPYAEERK